MQEVAELVEERDDIVVLHQGGPLRLSGVRKIADERGLGELDSLEADDEGERRRMVEFPRAGMEVEVEPPEPPPTIEDVVDLDGFMPGGDARHALVSGAEEVAGDAEDSVPDLLELEVGPDLLRAEVVSLRPDPLDEVRKVPGMEPLRARGFLAFSFQENSVVLVGSRAGSLRDFLDEVRGRFL